MGITYEKLRPRASSIDLDGEKFVLHPFVLAKQVWAHYEFRTEKSPDGLAVLNRRLQDRTDVEAWTKLLYELTEKKLKEKYKTYDLFVKALGRRANKKYVLGLYNSISECIGNSQLDEEETEGEAELKKSVALVS